VDLFTEYEEDQIILPGSFQKPRHLINLQNPKELDALPSPVEEQYYSFTDLKY